MLALFVVLLNAFIAVIAFYNFYYKRKGLPPGPTPLPIFGNALSILSKPPGEKCYLDWHRKYGDVYTFWLGEMPIVCISTAEKILETFQRDGESYAGRPTFEEFEKLIRGGKYGVVFTEGHVWREHRRFTLHLFRDFGVGKNLMEERILDEFSAMARKIDLAHDEDPKQEFDLAHHFIDPAVGSIINNILFGYRFDGDKMKEFFELKGALQHFMKTGAKLFLIPGLYKPQILMCIPFIRSLILEHKSAIEVLHDFFGRQIEAHRAEIDLSDLDAPPTDYVEAFLKQQAKLDNDGGENTFNIQQLKGMCFDLWLAGQETTSTTLAWGMAYLVNHPEVAKRAQAELEEVVGCDRRIVTIADRPNLPYINAVINEIQRVANLVPNNVMHTLTRDVVVDGYPLKKGTVIVPGISDLFIDDKVFKNPLEFRPERFLDADGKLIRCDALIPFGVGKRQCLGEPLARYELFLFLANLLQKYEFLCGSKMPSLVRIAGGVATCPNFTCRVQKRE